MSARQSTSRTGTVNRLAFLGTPPAAATCLSRLIDAGFDITLAVTRPDRRRGRGSKLQPSPVKETALAHGVPVSHDPKDLLTVDVDLAVVVAYGRILRTELLDHVEMVNVHFSLLPRWRGAAPVERAILAGDASTGVGLMKITEGLDEGPTYSCRDITIGDDESVAALTGRLAVIGSDLLIEHLSRPQQDPVPQVGAVSYADKIDRSENQLDFARPALQLHRRVRIGRAWTTFRGDRIGIEQTRVRSGSRVNPGRIQVVDGDDRDGDDRDDELTGDRTITRRIVVGTADGGLELVSVKPAGRRAMSALDWINGAQPGSGETLG